MADVTQQIIAGGAILGLLTGAVGGMASARKDSVIKVLTQDNVATKEYNKTLEAELAKVTAERNVFRDNAQGSDQLKSLTKAIENQTKVISDYFSSQKGAKRGRPKK